MLGGIGLIKIVTVINYLKFQSYSQIKYYVYIFISLSSYEVHRWRSNQENSCYISCIIIPSRTKKQREGLTFTSYFSFQFYDFSKTNIPTLLNWLGTKGFREIPQSSIVHNTILSTMNMSLEKGHWLTLSLYSINSCNVCIGIYWFFFKNLVSWHFARAK